MSRFDDELRDAAGRLADEAMPPGMLDEALATAAMPRRLGAAAGVVGMTAVVVMAAGIGWGIGRQTPDQTPDPSVPTLPSAVPSTEPVRHEVEVDGIRLAVELDRDRAIEGVPVLATATVENLRADSIYYPVSSTCEWATDISVEAVPPFGRGRAWDGAAADLKRSLLREWGVSDFTPYYFVGAERLPDLGTGCFMDAGRNEIAAGASRIDELAWRPVGPFGMPLPSGMYEVTATFARIPSDDENHNRDMSDDVTLRFDIEIEGSSDEYLMPGEAVDIILADDRMQAFLTDVRRELWLVTTLEYRDGLWVVTIPVRQPSARIVLDYSVVAEVDARSGTLLSVNLNDGATAQPSPPPAEPVTASVEDEGVRLTVTLDRDRTVFGQRVLGTVTVDNIGADSVFWGHSGTCEYPASVQLRPDQPVRLEYGREDWPGEDGILKSVTVDERIGTADPSFGFLPASWLDFEGTMGCTSDLVISELPAGESIVQEVGWDTLGYYDMPPPPGSYTVDASFAFMSRGARPDMDQVIDEFVVDLTLAIVIEGPEIDFVSPGEAVDALLADEAFREHLADVPRRMWLQSDILFVDGRWETALYFSARSSDTDPIEAIVAVVDAKTGVVLSVSREERRPPGT